MKLILQQKLQKSMKHIFVYCGFHSNIYRSYFQKFSGDLNHDNFSMIVGTDHSYVKMNWNQCFEQEELSDVSITKAAASDVKIKISNYSIENDESDDIEKMKIIASSLLSK